MVIEVDHPELWRPVEPWALTIHFGGRTLNVRELAAGDFARLAQVGPQTNLYQLRRLLADVFDPPAAAAGMTAEQMIAAFACVFGYWQARRFVAEVHARAITGGRPS